MRIIKWHGGKQYLSKFFRNLAPAHTHRTYAYCGGLGEMFAWPPECPVTGQSIAEAVNDLDGEITNFWLCVRDRTEELGRLLSLTPFSKPEWDRACAEYGQGDPLRRAVNFLIRWRQSYNATGNRFAFPGKSRLRGGMSENVSAWLSAVDVSLYQCAARMRRVEIRNQHALDFITQWDAGENTLHYLDPPYHPSVVTCQEPYDLGMTREDHENLLDKLETVKGRFMLSMYPCEAYDRRGFVRTEIGTGKIRPDAYECVYTNYQPPEDGVEFCLLHGRS